jgi:trigger factor
MKTEAKKLPKSQVEIIVELAVEELNPYLEKAAIKISEEIKIDGFRPGKAPYDVIKQKVGEMAILQEATDDIISQTYLGALKENNLNTVGQPQIALDKIAPGNPFIYKATVSLLPTVKIGDYSQLRLKRKKINIESEQVNKVVGDIVKMRAKEKLVERAAQVGDRLEVDFEVLIDKVAIEHGNQKKYPITIGEGRFIPGFEEQLVGLKANEEKFFELKFPENYYQKNLAGKNAEFKVKCLAVFEVELPEVNDSFAQEISAGSFKNLAELTENIKKNLEQEEKYKQEQRLELEILEKLVELSDFEEIPEALIHNEIHKMLHELEDSISQQGFKFNDYLQSINKTAEDLEKEFAPQAEQRVKTAIISREIYQEQKMEVRPDEVEKEVEGLLKNYAGNPEAKKQLESETYKDYLKNILGNRKVLEYLKGKIVVEE